MSRISILAMGVALATLFFAFLVLTTSAATAYGTTTHTTLADFNAGELYHTGLTRTTVGGGDGDGEVRLLTVGIAGEWYTDTNASGLPGLFGHAAVQYNGYLYVIGGHDGTAPQTEVYYTKIQTATHDLDDWTQTTALPSATYPNGVYHLGAAVLNGRIYVVGGWDQVSASYFNTVAHAPINADGTLGSWSTTTVLPADIYFARMVASSGRLYVLAGQDPSGAVDTVYYAEPDPDTGAISPGGWQSTTPLPQEMFAHMVTTWEDRIYVAGGSDGTTFYPYVYFAAPITTTGVITSWTATTNMEHNLYGAAAVIINGEMFTTGGAKDNNSNPSDYVGAGLLDRTGGVIGWVDTSLVSPARFFHATVASDDGWIYVIGGSDGTDPIDAERVNRGATAGEGSRQYAPSGEFTSSVIDLTKDRTITELTWNTVISDTTNMTITMSYRSRTQSGSWSAWQGPYPSVSQIGVATTSVSISETARYFQYLTYFTTEISKTTPVLNWVKLKYILPSPDLKIVKDDDRDAAYLGDVLTYTIYYTNAGGAPALNTYITETRPAYTTAPAAWNPGWTDMGNRQYRYFVSEAVSPTESGQVTFVIQVNDQVPEGVGILSNRVFIESQVLDENSDDNRFTHVTPLHWVDLHLSLSDGVATTQPGKALTYTMAYTNVGSVAATGGVITLTIPEHTAPCGDNTGWVAAGGRQYTRNLSTIAAGVRYEVTFVVCVDDPVDPSVTSLEATATIADDGSHGADLEPADNTDTDTDLLAWFEIALLKTDNRAVVFRGQTLVYEITITNTGNADMIGMLNLTDTLPLNTTHVDAGYGWTGAGQTWTKSMPVSLTPGNSAVTYISLEVNLGAPTGTMTNTVAAWMPDLLHPDQAIAYDVDIVAEESPNLSLTISDGTNAIAICQTQTYIIQYYNDGTRPATGVMITVTLPASMTYVGTGWQSAGGGRYTMARPDLEAGSNDSVSFLAALTEPTARSRATGRDVDGVRAAGALTVSPADWPDTLVLTATIGCAQFEELADNLDTDVDTLQRPDLYVVSVTPIPAEPVMGQRVIFRVVVGNSGTVQVANDCIHGFWVDLYKDPAHRPEEREYSNVDVSQWVSDIDGQATQTVDLEYTFPSVGTFTIYVQANPDRFWGIPESDFYNNTSEPVIIDVGPPRILLPLVLKSYKP